MKESALAIHRCPRCRGRLALESRTDGGGAGEPVTAGALRCAGCDAVYRVADGVAHLIVEREEIGAFKRQEIEGWACRAESGRGQQIERALWTRLPHVDGLAPEDGSLHWREAALSFPVALALLEPRPGRRVLEVGAAVGWASHQIARRGAEVIATDICAGPLQEAGHFLEHGPYFERLCADAEHLPLADETFDAVFCCAAIHHFENPGRLLGEVARVLRKGGRFVAINEPNRPLQRSERSLLGAPDAVTQLHLEFGIHEQVFTHGQYRRFFERAGLKFRAVHPRWDAVAAGPEAVRVEIGAGLKGPAFTISGGEGSRLRRLAQALGAHRLLGRSRLLAGLARQALFHCTHSFRVLVGEK